MAEGGTEAESWFTVLASGQGTDRFIQRMCWINRTDSFI